MGHSDKMIRKLEGTVMKKFCLLLAICLVLTSALPILAQDMLDYPSDLTECEVDLTGETINIFHFGDLSGPLRLHHPADCLRLDRRGQLLE